MPLFFQEFFLGELKYLPIRLTKTKFFLGNTNTTDRKSGNEQSTNTER